MRSLGGNAEVVMVLDYSGSMNAQNKVRAHGAGCDRDGGATLARNAARAAEGRACAVFGHGTNHDAGYLCQTVVFLFDLDGMHTGP